MNKGSDIVWDVIVVGGGPAGMMSAGRSAERGAKVLLLEKNDSLGKKLLITGGGRCNVTNAEPDERAFFAKYKEDARFLHSAFAQHGVNNTLEFFHSRGMPTIVEAYHRVFPKTERAQSVWDVLVKYMQGSGVTVRSHVPVAQFIVTDEKVSGVKLESGEDILARTVIVATGGKSHPETGSTGDGFRMLQNIGHTIIQPDPSLVPITIREAWVKELSGVTLEDTKISVLLDREKMLQKRGRALFTHVGLSGPTILNMSKAIGELLPCGEVTLSLELLPMHEREAFSVSLRELLRTESNKLVKNVLPKVIPSALVAQVLTLAEVSSETPAHSVTREDRARIVEMIKALPMTVSGLLGAEKAIVTSGGVSLDEVDFKTMCSRLHPNVAIVGDLLNIDRPSGGFSLQLCWTTGWVAGEHVPLSN